MVELDTGKKNIADILQSGHSAAEKKNEPLVSGFPLIVAPKKRLGELHKYAQHTTVQVTPRSI